MSERESPITPTVGRVVLVRGTAIDIPEPWREYPAIITRVWGQNIVNLDVSNERPGGVQLKAVPFFDSDVCVAGAAWRWMPYQVQVAKERDPTTGKARSEATDAAGSIGDATAPGVRERIVQEAAEVGARLNKLTEFLQNTEALDLLSPQAERLLRKQREIMISYTYVLAERLILLDEEG